MQLPSPYALFLGDADRLSAKTATGIAYWRPERCVAQVTLPGCSADLGLPSLSPRAAHAAGARLLIVGIANVGGLIAAHWLPSLLEALEAGLDLAAGLHHRLADVPALAQAAARLGRRLYDVRQPQPGQTPMATGRKRQGRRLLTVGTDCVVGKMFTSLALERELQRRGRPATFRATGQTGIFIAGSGVSVDAVISDFVAGAAEALSPDNAAEHWDLIEGQGSLHHPAYAGVTLGLIHGSQPDALVLCHVAGREHIDGYEDYPIPGFPEAIAANERAARLTNPRARVIGISVNTSKLSAAEGDLYLRALQQQAGLPCCDPVRSGVAPLADALLELE
ncbi:MAG: DUF1611 domain-containing protein [Proteobacteria bacterium]|nr:DUF1611 domain-containing protein [Pseudomonadota bacterium]